MQKSTVLINKDDQQVVVSVDAEGKVLALEVPTKIMLDVKDVQLVIDTLFEFHENMSG